MAPVNWNSLDGKGDRVEDSICTMLHHRHPSGIHRRPGSGDRGIDFHIPDHPDGHLVYQIKSFTSGELTPSRKTQIKNSLKRALEIEPPISRWHLVTPMNPTELQEDWFRDEVAKGAPIECNWDHRPFCDTLAAQYPTIADYYFEGGENRYAQMFRDFRTVSDGLIPTEPSAALDVLQTLSLNLNRLSIFYRFDLETYPPETADERFEVASRLGNVVYGTLHVFETTAVALLARPIYPQAVEDEQLRIQMTTHSSDLEKAELASEPGGPFELDADISSDSLGIDETSRARVTPHPVDIQVEGGMSLRAMRGESEVRRLDLPKGVRWPGLTLDTTRWSTTDAEISLTLRKRHDNDNLKLTLKLDLEGRTAMSARSAARLLRAAGMDDVNLCLYLGDNHLHSLSDDLQLLATLDRGALWYEAIDLLATLSAETEALPNVPDPRVCEHDLQDLRSAVDLLRGRVVPTEGVTITLCLPEAAWTQYRQQHMDGESFDFIVQFQKVDYTFHVIEDPISIEGVHIHLRRYDFDFDLDHACADGQRALRCAPTEAHRTIYHLDSGSNGTICASLPINEQTW